MGRFVIVIGTQWGDEGKGKIVDLLTERAVAVAMQQMKDHPVPGRLRHPGWGPHPVGSTQ